MIENAVYLKSYNVTKNGGSAILRLPPGTIEVGQRVDVYKNVDGDIIIHPVEVDLNDPRR